MKENGLTVREKLEAEHNGESVVESDRFEAGISHIAALIHYFTEEQAEIRLIAGNDDVETGLGKAHLYGLLRKLAVVEPVFAEEIDPQPIMETIEALAETTTDTHIFLVTTLPEAGLPREIAEMVNLANY